jgi:hypothetical protein
MKQADLMFGNVSRHHELRTEESPLQGLLSIYNKFDQSREHKYAEDQTFCCRWNRAPTPHTVKKVLDIPVPPSGCHLPNFP